VSQPHTTLHVWRVRPRSVGSALTRMALDPRRLRALPRVRFAKLLGTGTGTTFGPTDADPTRYAALIVWDSPEAAAGFDESPPGRGWARLSQARARLDLRPLSSRGRWSGRDPFASTGDPASETATGTGTGHRAGMPRQGPGGGPVLALTRARLRPRRALTFWRAVPPVAAALATAPGLLGRFGVGEAPIGWQGTVSVWESSARLVDFAYRHPEHRAAVARTPVAQWYAEELFARFAVLDVTGERAVLGWSTGSGRSGGR